jgi:hypothetical protein
VAREQILEAKRAAPRICEVRLLQVSSHQICVTVAPGAKPKYMCYLAFSRSNKVIGMHSVNPVRIMKLAEIILDKCSGKSAEMMLNCNNLPAPGSISGAESEAAFI